MTCCYRLGLAALLLLDPLHAAAPGDLQVFQPILAENGGYVADSRIRISFTLAAPGDVTVEIAAHRALEDRGPQVVPEPRAVRTLTLGPLPAGRHDVVWDGLGADGRPVLQKFLKRRSQLQDRVLAEGWIPKSDDLIGEKLVDLLQIRVASGGQSAATNFLRLEGPVPDSRTVPAGFDCAVSDGEGGCYVASFQKWRAWRFDPLSGVAAQYPAFPQTWNGNVPVEAKQVSAKNGFVYVMSQGNALLRFHPDGSEAPWEAKADFVRGARLGITVSKPKPGAKNRLDLGGRTMEYDATEAAGIASRPGFAFSWGGADADEGQIYVVRDSPAQELQIFDLKGNYLRSLPLPPDSYRGVRCDGRGRLWLIGPRGPKLFDPRTGSLLRTLRNPQAGSFSGLSVGLDGTLYAWTSDAVHRFTGDGDAKPFASGETLKPGLKIQSATGDQDGNVLVFTADQTKRSESPDAQPRLLVFDAEGARLPLVIPDISVGSQCPGNVFVEADPARLVVFITSLAKTEMPGRLEWTLTGYDGARTQGVFDFPIAPMGRQAVPVPVPAQRFGHYVWEAKVTAGGRFQGNLTTAMARIRQRSLAPSQDSPFAMVWGRDFYLMALAGVKKERVGSTSWSTIEPFDGVLSPEVDDITTGFRALRRDAARWGIRLGEMFNYGEPWTSRGWLVQLHSFDRYFRHIMSLVDQVDDPHVDHFQFWNEPNNFWKLPGPFNREHYAVVAKNCWSIVKARAKEYASICDGDATTFGMMQELAQHGAAGFNDAVECHYLGASSVSITAMKSDVLEGKADTFQGLVKLRDKYYPGKPILDTEEGVWGNRKLSVAEGAQAIPRVHIPLLAAGLDALYWFRFSCESNDVHSSHLLDLRELPQPSYCTYATMTRMLEGAEPVARIDLGNRAVFAYLFIRNGQAIVPIWTSGDDRDVELPAAVFPATLVDAMDRHLAVRGPTLKATKEVRYVVFPGNAWTAELAGAELARRLKSLKVDAAASLPQEIAEAARTASADDAQMNRLFYLAAAAKIAALAGDPAGFRTGRASAAQTAREDILKREGTDGYLSDARLVLSWADRLKRAARNHDPATGVRLGAVSALIAETASHVAAVEEPVYPGVAVNAFIGDAGEIEKIRATKVAAPDYPLVDAQFRYELPRKPGESVSLELSVWNFYRHPIQGEIVPRLPEGWTASMDKKTFSLQPGEFARILCEVEIPADAESGVYKIGGTAHYAGQEIPELHSQRVKVTAGSPR